MKRTVLIAFLTMCSVHLHGAVPIDADAFRKSVVFIYYADASGKPSTLHFATGFVVSVPLNQNPKRAYTFIVTARHVIDPEWVGCAYTQNPQTVFIRVNTKSYDPSKNMAASEYLPLELTKNGERLWFANPDNSVDVAIVPVFPQTRLPLNGRDWNIYDYDVLSIPFQLFPTDTELAGLGIGTSVFSAGVVPELADAKRNYPTFKFGRISNIFDEPLTVPCKNRLRPSKNFSVWAIAANFVPGNSGSPVFLFPIDVVTPGGGIALGGLRPFVAGLISTTVIGADFSGMTPVQRMLETFKTITLQDADWTRGNPPPSQAN